MNHARANVIPFPDVSRYPLLDGPLIPYSAGRIDAIRRMADCLTAADVDLGDKQACVSRLLRSGFHSLKVAFCLDDARTLAFQDVVAAEMARVEA